MLLKLDELRCGLHYVFTHDDAQLGDKRKVAGAAIEQALQRLKEYQLKLHEKLQVIDPFISGYRMPPVDTWAPSSIETYLSTPAIPKLHVDQAGGITEWWAAQEKSGSPVARMGLDTFRAKMAIGTPLLQDLDKVLGILEGRQTTDPGPLNI
ncbi:hypothetical protein OPQ81_004005 [Rhizoctonia solani]|nr:hypothetical protein OPQ81_004005 [Rhizoctonia solani]